jgi:hypothetical protein
MLIDMLKDVEQKAGVTPPPEPAPFTAADEEVMATFIARLRQAWEEELRQKATENAGSSLERLRPPTSSPGEHTTRCCGSTSSTSRNVASAS